MPGASVGIAVIGCGSTAFRRHLPVWRDLPGAHLVAVASRDAERRETAARDHGAPLAVERWRELLANPDVDAFDICVPHPQHAEIALAAAAAGKHILCEKPLAPDLASAERMVAAARAAGVVLMPFHNMRLGGASATALEVVRAGAIGRPQLLRGVMAHGGPDRSDPRRRWFLEAAAGGGAILDLGPHLFDLAAALMPEPARRVRATLRHATGDAVERDGLVEVLYADGALAQLTLSWSHVAGRETTLAVQGTSGVLRLCLLLSPDPSPDAPARPLTLAKGTGGQLEMTYPAVAAGGEPCALFLRALAGEAVPLTPEAGLEPVRYIDAAYRSARQGGAWIDL